jgi:hypothetical protein
MATTVSRKKSAVLSEVRLSVHPQMPFEELVAALKVALTVPELPGFKGCRPCLSGLDRFILEDIAMKGMR